MSVTDKDALANLFLAIADLAPPKPETPFDLCEETRKDLELVNRELLTKKKDLSNLSERLEDLLKKDLASRPDKPDDVAEKGDLA